MQNGHPISELTRHHCSKETGSHILYIYNELDKYLLNTIHFISEGLANSEIVFVIESDEMIRTIQNELILNGLNVDSYPNVIFANNKDSYLTDDQFDISKARELLILVKPYTEKKMKIRTWGHVPLTDSGAVLEKLRLFELECDAFVSRKDITTVCIYNGMTTPAYVQNELLKTHTHIMTDRDFNQSPFYNRDYFDNLTLGELERLRNLERQNSELKYQNTQLIAESHLAKLKHEMIMQSEKKLQLVFSRLPIPIIIRKDRKIIFANHAASEHFTLIEESTIEENFLKQFFEKYDHLEGDSVEQPLHHQYTLQNGKEKYYIVQSIELSYESKTAVMHSFVDASYEKENEQIMIRSEKMNIAGELAASIAHELRNPLTSIKGFFQMMKYTDEKKDLYFKVIDDELSRIEQISGELLTLAKPNSDDRKESNIVQIIYDVQVLLESRAHMENIEITVDSTSKEMTIYCDTNRIKQVFINLIKNAIDAMETGGKVCVKVKNSMI